MIFNPRSLEKPQIFCITNFIIGLTLLPTSASVLTFESTTFSGNGNGVDSDYGDRITATTMGNFSYGGAGGFTPNIEVSYLGSSGTGLSHWTTGYNDLIGVAYHETDFENSFTIQLSADAGILAQLNGFDLGNFGGAAVVLPTVQVLGSGGAILFSETNVSLDPNVDPHLSFDFPTPLESSELTISIDTTGLGGNSDNIGIDNIGFSQIPEPSSAIFVTLASLGLAFKRRLR